MDQATNLRKIVKEESGKVRKLRVKDGSFPQKK